GLGDDWKAALAQVKEQHVPPGQQDDLVAAQSREMLAFLDDHQLVTVPPLCRDTFRFTMIDEGVQKTLPYAAYGGPEVLVALPPPRDGQGPQAAEHARQQRALLAHRHAPRARPRPPPAGLHGPALRHAARLRVHALPRRGLVALLGAAPVGPRLGAGPRGPPR